MQKMTTKKGIIEYADSERSSPDQLKQAEDKFVALAEKMTQEQYAWRRLRESVRLEKSIRTLPCRICTFWEWSAWNHQ